MTDPPPLDGPLTQASLFDVLRRYPDIEGPSLVAVDASDRLVLDEAAPHLAVAPEGTVVVLGDRYGALTLGAAAQGARGLRTAQDALTGERALSLNAERSGLTGTFTSVGLDGIGLAGARVVLLQLPRSLAALDEIAEQVAAHADPRVVLIAGGRLKHMTRAMNDVLGRHFATVEARLARQKSRVLVATSPLASAGGTAGSRWPAQEHHADLDLTVCAHGAAFAGTRIDHGTRTLLAHLGAMHPAASSAVDLGCGTGVLAVALARARPGLHVTATDESAAAVASARATVATNGLAGRVDVVRDDALGSMADASVDLVVLNPPFHLGSTVHTGVAHRMFADAGRVLAPGGELWCVWNSHLQYRPALERTVGPTRQASRTPTFTVTVSTRPTVGS